MRSRRRKIVVRSFASQDFSLGSVINTIQFTMPGVGWVTENNDARQGVVGCTLQRHFIAIPSSIHGNQYFWFNMNDENGNPSCPDPGDYESSLSGYTGNEIILSNSVRSPAQVATALNSVAQSVYGAANVSISDDTVSIILDTNVGSIFTGSPWSSRGQAGYWGAESYIVAGLGHDDGFSLSGNVDGTFFAHIVPPAINNNRLCAIQFLTRATVGSPIRLGVYVGEDVEDTENSTLLYDSGVILAANLNANSWNTHYVTEDIALENEVGLFISFSCQASSSTSLNFQEIDRPIGEWTARDVYVGGLSNNVNDPLPQSIPSGATPSGLNIVPAIRLVYAAAPYAGDGQWQRNQWPTPYIAANDWPNVSLGFSNQIVSGGNLPPDVGGLYASRIGATMTRSAIGLGARMWIAQGGTLRAPGGALVNSNSEVRLNHTNTSRDIWWTDYTTPIPVDNTARVWLGLEGDGVGDVHFQLIPGGPANIAPRWGAIGHSNPLDWPDNVVGESEMEYENIDNPAQEVDPANPTESPYPIGLEEGAGPNEPVPPGDTFVAFRPENVTPQVIDLQTNTFVIEEV